MRSLSWSMVLQDLKPTPGDNPLLHLLLSPKGEEALSGIEQGDLLILFGALQHVPNDWGGMFTQILVMLDDRGVTLPKGLEFESRHAEMWKKACQILETAISPPEVDVFAYFWRDLMQSGLWLERVWIPRLERIRIASENVGYTRFGTPPIRIWPSFEAPWFFQQLQEIPTHTWIAHIPKTFGGIPPFLEGMSQNRTPKNFKLKNGDLVLIGG